jgi:hypothetical protein
MHNKKKPWLPSLKNGKQRNEKQLRKRIEGKLHQFHTLCAQKSEIHNPWPVQYGAYFTGPKCESSQLHRRTTQPFLMR